MMHYKGYSVHVVFDDEENVFHGEVLGIRDVLTFQGTTVAELRQAFHDSIDDYVEFCRERGEAPEKPLSGRFVVRLPAELHRNIASLARISGQSLNAWIVGHLTREVEGTAASGKMLAVRPRTKK